LNSQYTGLNHVIDLNGRLSFAYGVAYKTTFNVVSGYSLSAFNVYNAPAELRFYVIPRDKNVTSYLFVTYNNVFVPTASYQSSLDQRKKDGFFYRPSVLLGSAVQTKVSGQNSVTFRAAFKTDFQP
ncbi:MAG: hypothetical protein ACKO96_29215, partial [Flammeovirgaceae bacterium]